MALIPDIEIDLKGVPNDLYKGHRLWKLGLPGFKPIKKGYKK